ncbi:thiamine phosphate synthase [Furfurilactobacillus curtus]|uniref:Thiamine-phosphate synthase n=1 Tax=Furfurilactobacillus curtus TaxID=1746200 RepID=A0ABQ5JKW4_9LACO
MKFNTKMLQAYFVAGSQDVPQGQTLPEQLSAAIAGGITAFQFREKGPRALMGAEKVALGQTLHELCRQAEIPFFVDDDVVLARTLRADGIHVGQKDQRIEQVINELPGLIIGYSCHTVAQINHANELTVVDYVGSGPVYPTLSKADADPALGISGLKQLLAVSKKPIVAIGGIDQNNLANVAQTGVAGAAVISMLTRADDVQMTATMLRRTFTNFDA